MKKKLRNKKKMKRILAVLVGVFLIAGVSAIYLFNYSGTSAYVIKGTEGELSVTIDLTDQTWFVNESLEHSQNIILENHNGLTNMTTNFEVVVNGTDPSCNETGDIEYKLFKGDVEILDNDVITMESGTNEFHLNSTAISDRACPRLDNVLIEFTE